LGKSANEVNNSQICREPLFFDRSASAA